VLARGLEDEENLLTDGAGAEQRHHDQGMGEADFGAVYYAVSDAFY